MATGSQLGKPAINDARGNSLRDLQQIVGNIRERFRIVDAAVSTLQTATAGINANTAGDLTALARRVTNLEQDLAALQAEVDALDLSGGDAGGTDPRVEQMAGELQQLQDQLDSQAADPGRLPQLEATVATLQQQVDDIDPVGQTPAHAAMLKAAQDQIDSLNRSYLL